MDIIGTDKAKKVFCKSTNGSASRSTTVGKEKSAQYVDKPIILAEKVDSESMESMMRCGTIQGSLTSAWEALALSKKIYYP